jgi:hypothetical protein
MRDFVTAPFFTPNLMIFKSSWIHFLQCAFIHQPKDWFPQGLWMWPTCCMLILGFLRDVDQICARLGYYAASCGTTDTWRWDRYVSPKTSVNNYQTTPRNIPEERRFHSACSHYRSGPTVPFVSIFLYIRMLYLQYILCVNINKIIRFFIKFSASKSLVNYKIRRVCFILSQRIQAEESKDLPVKTRRLTMHKSCFMAVMSQKHPVS